MSSTYQGRGAPASWPPPQAGRRAAQQGRTVVDVHSLEEVGVAVRAVGEHAAVGVKVAEAAVGAAHHAHPARTGEGSARNSCHGG